MDEELGKKFAIFGSDVEYSKSPVMQEAAFKHKNINATYKKHNLKDGTKIKEEFLKAGYDGANITTPYKEIAFELADEVRGIAKKIGAVNTYIKEEEKVIGLNTDADGFMRAIEDFGTVEDVLIIGAGGTAKALAVALKKAQKRVSVVNRSADKLNFFKELGCIVNSWRDYHLDAYDLIVNATSVGLKEEYPFKKSKLENIFINSSFAFDCIYAKETPFLALAKEEGLKTKNGEDMLVYQGALALEYFADIKNDKNLIEIMKDSLEEELIK